MSRISRSSEATYPWYLRVLFRFQKKKYGAVLDPVLLWGRIPSVFIPFLLMQKALSRKKSFLPPTLRALVTVKVSQLNHCAFCVDMNSALLLEKGDQEDKLSALSQFRESPLFTENEKEALEYAEAVTLASNKVPDTLFDRLKRHYSEDAIVELTALIAFQNLSSKFNAALDVTAFGFCKTPT